MQREIQNPSKIAPKADDECLSLCSSCKSLNKMIFLTAVNARLEHSNKTFVNLVNNFNK